MGIDLLPSCNRELVDFDFLMSTAQACDSVPGGGKCRIQEPTNVGEKHVDFFITSPRYVDEVMR